MIINKFLILKYQKKNDNGHLDIRFLEFCGFIPMCCAREYTAVTCVRTAHAANKHGGSCSQ